MDEYTPLYTNKAGTSSKYMTDNNSDVKARIIDMFKILFAIVACLLLIGLVVMIVLLVSNSNKHNNDQSKNLNIYVRLSQQCVSDAIDMNNNMTQYDEEGHQMIDLTTKQLPHITLFLTSFDKSKLTLVEEAIKSVAASNYSLSEICAVEVEPLVTVSGNYIMWHVKVDDCIQTFSDMIVNATMDYVSKEAKDTIPDWIQTLPEPIKQKKIEMIHKYGSPNVFSQFDPHVTLAWSTTNSTILQEIVEEHIHAPSCVFVIDQIGLGVTGPYGTVLRGQDLIDVNVPYVPTHHNTKSLTMDDVSL